MLAGTTGDYRLAGDSWEAFRAILSAYTDWIARFVREQPIQTNEPQRCWALLPLFLTVARAARRPLDLLELGTGAGLNLLWDRYRYEYEEGSWGPADAPLVLRGEERSPFPPELLATDVEIRRRRGIDLNPLDVTNDDDLRLLLSFAAAEQRRERIGKAKEAVRDTPPEIVQGDYLDLLPGLLEERDDEALTLVFQTISTVYLALEDRYRLREMISRAGAAGPLAWISTPTPEEHGLRGTHYPLELAIWPNRAPRLVAQMANGGEWLDWWK